MTQRITPETLATIRQRTESATAGPWTTQGRYVIGADGIITAASYENAIDAAFIANARQDIPMLLAEIERLQSILEPLYVEGIISREDEDDDE
jgi:hypothetical protein